VGNDIFCIAGRPNDASQWRRVKGVRN
jgi:hypothetical protein